MVTETAQYDTKESLKNGLRVRVRAIRPDDKCLLVKAFNELEPESIYTRFFQRKKRLSTKELQKATELDFENEVGLVVTIDEEGTEAIIGSGSYAAYNTPMVHVVPRWPLSLKKIIMVRGWPQFC